MPWKSNKKTCLATVVSLSLLIFGLSGCQIGKSQIKTTNGALATTGKTGNKDEANKRLRIVTTTPILADLVRNVAGPQAEVTSLVPPGADPHTYEPSLRDVRSIVYADAIFSNNLLLEEQSLIRTIDANLPKGVANTRVAEESKKYGSHLIQLVEDPSLNTIWLGMRVNGEGINWGANRDSEVRLQATGASGPGNLAAFLTGTFGQPQVYLSSGDGFDAGQGYQSDTVKLPTNAHTHMSWAFTKPGVYRLKVAAQLANLANVQALAKPDKCKLGQNNPELCAIASGEITFAVGVDPHKVPGKENAQVLNAGHMDLTVDLDQGRLEFYGDRIDKKPGNAHYDLDKTVIAVPNAALNQIPADPEYRFLGRPGQEAYVLAQAVLGKHVHGEIDPHLWQSVPNTKTMVEVIRDTLINADNVHRERYLTNAQHYLQKLDRLDKYIHQALSTIPTAQRNLVTTHDAFGYLANTYSLNVAGFVTSNPSKDPSARDIIALTRTLRDLQVKAVFVEPNTAAHVADLRQAARQTGVTVCQLYGDTFTKEVDTYLKLMATNAYNLKVCLDPDNAPPARFNLGEENAK